MLLVEVALPRQVNDPDVSGSGAGQDEPLDHLNNTDSTKASPDQNRAAEHILH
jgi:hypothetical protein